MKGPLAEIIYFELLDFPFRTPLQKILRTGMNVARDLEEHDLSILHTQNGLVGVACVNPLQKKFATGVRIPLGPGVIIRCKNLALYIRDCVSLCLSDHETLKAVGPFYLVSMPGEVKYPISLHWKCVTCRGLHNLA